MVILADRVVAVTISGVAQQESATTAADLVKVNGRPWPPAAAVGTRGTARRRANISLRYLDRDR